MKSKGKKKIPHLLSIQDLSRKEIWDILYQFVKLFLDFIDRCFSQSQQLPFFDFFKYQLRFGEAPRFMHIPIVPICEVIPLPARASAPSPIQRTPHRFRRGRDAP